MFSKFEATKLIFGGIDEPYGDMLSVDGGGYQIETRRYYVHDEIRENVIEVFYPQIIKLNGDYDVRKINNILRDIVFETSAGYGLSPYGLKMHFDYEVMYSSETFLSIKFEGWTFKWTATSSAAYPIDYIKTVNLDLRGSTDNMRLRDFFIIDDGFVEAMKKYPIFDSQSFGISEAAFEYLYLEDWREEYPNERIIRELFAADGAVWSVKSYFGIDRVGIGLRVPRNMGDVILLELKYEDLMDNIKHDNPLWSELLT